MFPSRYFPDRYFAARYWPKIGATGALLPDFEIGTTENLMARYMTESLLPEYTTTSRQPRLTTDPLF